jgi:hypothetical protein
MDQIVSFNGKQMRIVSTAEVGVVNAETLFTFTQERSIVSAHYSGGKVRLDYLVGIISSEILHFRYAQLDTEGRLDGGYSMDIQRAR